MYLPIQKKRFIFLQRSKFMDGKMSNRRRKEHVSPPHAQIPHLPKHQRTLADKIGRRPRRREGVHLHRSLQTTPRQGGHGKCRQLEGGNMEATNGTD